jgi:hypothetical protein
MTNRTFSVACLALLGASLILLPGETSARSAGMAGGRSFAPPAFRPPVARPVVKPPAAQPARVAPATAARTAIPATLTKGAGGHAIVLTPPPFNRGLSPDRYLHASHPLLRDLRRHQRGWPVTLWGGPGIYYYDPSAQTDASAAPRIVYPAGDPPSGLGPNGYPVPEPRGCHTQHQIVPKVGGGESTINIVRC